MSHIPISGELTIYQVGELKPLLQQALDQSIHDLTGIQLDLGGVTEIDGAGLQLLLSIAKTVPGTEVEFTLHNVPEAVLQVIQTFNLANRFKMVQGSGQ
jgi:anti-anti-sigma factor